MAPAAAGMMVAMDDVDALPTADLLSAARRGDEAAFEKLVALQESLLGAWRGLSGF